MSEVDDMSGCLSVLQKHIILLLYARDCEPIPGASWLQNELFLISQNAPEVSKEASFSSGALGPHSKNADEQLNDLILRRMVEKVGDKFFLSDLGVKTVNNAVKEVSRDTLELVDEFKELLNDMSEKELTCLIYFTFPESYASMAPDVIREDRFAVAEALFRKEKISIGKAAEISGVSYEEFREHTLRRR